MERPGVGIAARRWRQQRYAVRADPLTGRTASGRGGNGVRNAQSTLAVDVQADPADPTAVVVRLDGELDITSSALLQTVVDQVLGAKREPRTTLLALDMSGVSFADAAGLS